MLAETARLFTSSPRESPIGSPPVPPTPVDSSLCGSRGVRLSSEAPAANAGAAAFPATVKCARQAPSVNRFHHPRPFTTLVGSPRTRNLFQISGLPPAASYLTESLEIAQLDLSSGPVRDMIADLVAHNVAITSTLAVFEAFDGDRPPVEQRFLDAVTAEAAISYLGSRPRARGGADAPALAELRKELQFEYAFVKAGGLLIAGADPTGNGGALAGFADQRNIELLVEGGFTPVEAIRIATYNGAKYLGETDRIGSIAAGKQADLVVIDGNPAARIADIRKVTLVFKDGAGYDPAKLLDSVKGAAGLH